MNTAAILSRRNASQRTLAAARSDIDTLKPRWATVHVRAVRSTTI